MLPGVATVLQGIMCKMADAQEKEKPAFDLTPTVKHLSQCRPPPPSRLLTQTGSDVGHMHSSSSYCDVGPPPRTGSREVAAPSPKTAVPRASRSPVQRCLFDTPATGSLHDTTAAGVAAPATPAGAAPGPATCSNREQVDDWLSLMEAKARARDSSKNNSAHTHKQAYFAAPGVGAASISGAGSSAMCNNHAQVRLLPPPAFALFKLLG